MRLPKLGLPGAAAIVLGLGLLTAMPLVDHDYFWHTKVGEWIVTHRWNLPSSEPFSFTSSGVPWVVQGWLFDSLQYLLERHFGDAGVRALYAALIVATWSLVYASAKLYLREPSRALLLTVLCAAAAAPFLSPRPLAATNLAFAFVLFALLKHRATGARVWLAALPPVFAIWVNLHFGYITGLALIGLFALVTTIERFAPIGGAPDEPGRLSAGLASIVLMVSVAALGANPYGWGVLTETLGMTTTNMNTNVIEWLSPDFRHWQAQLFLPPLALLFAARCLAARRAQWLDLLMALSLTGAALYSQRHIPLACIGLAPLLARAFASWSPGTIEYRAPAAMTMRVRGSAGRELGALEYRLNWAFVVLAVVTAALLQPSASARQERRLRLVQPVEAADFVQTHQLTGPMFHDYHLGGYLMQRLHPRVPVFIDGRYNPYIGAPLRDYLTLMQLGAGWQALLEKYDIRLAVLASPGEGLAGAMADSGKYRLVHADKGFGVLIRNDGSRPDLPAVSASLAASARREAQRP